MILKEFMKTKKIFPNTLATDVNTFYNQECPIWLTSDFLNMIELNIKSRYSNKELFKDDEDDVQILTYLLFVINNEKYKHLVNLFETEYNPLATYYKKSKSTLDYKGSSKETETPTGSESSTYAKSGSEQKTFVKGAEKTTNVRSNTTFDSDTFYDGIKDVEDSNTYTDTTTDTYLNRSDTRTKSFTNRKTEKETTYNNRQDERNTTVEGNIGIFITQDLANKEMEYADKIKLIEIISKDLVREICLMC